MQQPSPPPFASRGFTHDGFLVHCARPDLTPTGSPGADEPESPAVDTEGDTVMDALNGPSLCVRRVAEGDSGGAMNSIGAPAVREGEQALPMPPTPERDGERLR